MSNFKINRGAIERMSREIEAEFAKHPVKIPLQADRDDIAAVLPTASTVNNYLGPVINVTGDGAQIAWGSGAVNQSHERIEQVAPGFESLAKIVTDLLASADQFELPEAEFAELRANATAVLDQVTAETPDKGVLRTSVAVLKGILAPVAVGLGAAATAETTELGRDVIDALGRSLPF